MSSILSGALLKQGISFQYGGLRARGPIFADGGVIGNIGIGNVFFVDPTNGSDSRNGRTPRMAFATLAKGEDKLIANQNDTLFYIAGSSGINLEEELVWNKSYTHLIGLCAPTTVAQRSRIFNKAGDAYDTAFASKALLKVTASGCLFQNFYLFQGADKTNTYYGSCHVTGGRNHFLNVHFAGLGATASGGNAAHASSYALKLDGAEENLFERCTIGVDTIKRTADNAILAFDGDAKRNEFVGCKIVSWAETNTYCIGKLIDTGALDRWTHFEKCLFYNFWTNHGGNLLEVFEVPASCATHDIILDDCRAVGALEWEANDRGQIWVDGHHGAATTGIMIEPVL